MQSHNVPKTSKADIINRIPTDVLALIFSLLIHSPENFIYFNQVNTLSAVCLRWKQIINEKQFIKNARKPTTEEALKQFYVNFLSETIKVNAKDCKALQQKIIKFIEANQPKKKITTTISNFFSSQPIPLLKITQLLLEHETLQATDENANMIFRYTLLLLANLRQHAKISMAEALAQQKELSEKNQLLKDKAKQFEKIVASNKALLIALEDAFKAEVRLVVNHAKYYTLAMTFLSKVPDYALTEKLPTRLKTILNNIKITSREDVAIACYHLNIDDYLAKADKNVKNHIPNAVKNNNIEALVAEYRKQLFLIFQQAFVSITSLIKPIAQLRYRDQLLFKSEEHAKSFALHYQTDAKQTDFEFVNLPVFNLGNIP